MQLIVLSLILSLSNAHGALPLETIFNEVHSSFPRVHLIIDPENSNTTAEAENDGEHLLLIVNQGLLDSPRITDDGFRMVLCHELGHLLGNDPRKSPPPEWTGPIGDDGMSLLSSEGQADFDSSRSCFAKLVQGQKHLEHIDQSKLTPRLVSLCNKAWGGDTQESHICLRASLGGENFLKLSFDFPISFETPDETVAPELIRDSYPERQCRLDTILAGALRSASRPACWLSPESSLKKPQKTAKNAGKILAPLRKNLKKTSRLLLIN